MKNYRNKKLLAFMIAAILYSSNSFSSMFSVLSDEEMEQASLLIQSKNFTKFKALLSSKKDESEQYDFLLDQVINDPTQGSRFGCRDEFVELLLKKKAKVSLERNGEIKGNQIYNSYFTGCLNNLKLLVQNSSPEFIAKSIPENAEAIRVTEIHEVDGGKITEEKRKTKIAQQESLKILISAVQPLCPKIEEELQPCKVLKSLLTAQGSDNKKIELAQKKDNELKEMDEKRQKEALASEQKLKDEDTFNQTPEGILKRACEAKKNIKIADEQIAFQKQVGANSGVIDKEALYTFGVMKSNAQNELEKLKTKYKISAKKELRVESCNGL